MISHFGRKPDKGGKPASDSRINGARAVIKGYLSHVEGNVLRLVTESSLSKRNAAVVMIRYIKSERVAKGGEYIMTSIIHPRWAMEEYANTLRSCV